MNNIKEALKKSSVFGGLDKDDIEQLETLFNQQAVHFGDILKSKGVSYEY